MMPSLLSLVTAAALLVEGVVSQQTPTVKVKNGTLEGRYLPGYNQDLFLGIPFAQPPVGQLRFQNPQSLNETFDTLKVKKYGDSCVGYGNSADQGPATFSENCLTLNVVRPAGTSKNAKLPVGLFIHGGGWTMDFAANGAYNMTFMVEEAAKAGKPFVAVSIAYRLAFWGFMASKDIMDAGVANLGLKDQRLAMHWVKENIGAFGGDASKVTIFGESAGGGNVGYHATAYGGRDDKLFRGIIAESGADGTDMKNLTEPDRRYNIIAEAAGCGDSSDKLACLRKVPFKKLNATSTKVPGNFYPVVDYDFIPDYPSILLENGKFVKVPLMAGTNADEGSFFALPGVDTDEQVAAAIMAGGVDANTTETLMALYPNIDALGIPYGYRRKAGDPVKAQFKRMAAFQGDNLFVSWRRRRSDAWSKYGVPVYTYLFESPNKNMPAYIGTPHFVEVAYVFFNKFGMGYGKNQGPLYNASKEVLDLAQLVSRMWISFITEGNPNEHGLPGWPKWPVNKNGGGYGENFYFNPNGSSVQPDTFRLAGTAYMNSLASEQFGR
ncbi:hypothetical protein QX201_005876 [Fusarium graminearum]